MAEINFSDLYSNEGLEEAKKELLELLSVIKQIAEQIKKKADIINPNDIESVRKLVVQVEKLHKQNEALTKGLKEVTVAQEKNIKAKKELKEKTDEQIAAIIKEREALKQKTAIIRATIRVQIAQNGSIDQLKARLKLANLEWNKMSQAQKDNTEKGKTLRRTIIGLKEDLKKQGNATKTAAQKMSFLNRISKSTSKTLIRLFVGRTIIDGIFRVAGALGDLLEKNKGTSAELSELSGAFDSVKRGFQAFGLAILTLIAPFAGLIKGVGDFITRLSGASTVSNDATDSFFKQLDAVNKLEQKVLPLADRYDELSKKSKLSTKEQKELDEITNKLAQDIPNTAKEFDKYGKIIGINTDAVRSFVQQQRNLLAVQNAAAIKEQTENLRELDQELGTATRLLFKSNKTKLEQAIVDKIGLEQLHAKRVELQNQVSGTKEYLEILSGLNIKESNYAKEVENSKDKTKDRLNALELLQKKQTELTLTIKLLALAEKDYSSQKEDLVKVTNQLEIATNALTIAQDKETFSLEKATEAQKKAIESRENQISKAQTSVIQDAKEKAIKAQSDAFGERESKLKEETKSFVKSIEKQRKEIVETFGAESSELKQFNNQALQDIETFEKQQTDLIVLERQKQRLEILAINEKFDKEELQLKVAKFSEDKQLRQLEFDTRILAIKEQQAKELIGEEQAQEEKLRLRRAFLQKELEGLAERETLLKLQAGDEVDIYKKEFAEIAKARQELNTKLAKLGVKTVEDSKKTSEDLSKNISEALNKASTEIIKSFKDQTTEAEKSLEEQNKLVENQRDRAEKGLSNTLAFEQREAAKQEAQLIARQKRLARAEQIKALYASYQGYASKGDGDQAITKTLRDFAVLQAITAGLKGFKSGGYTGDGGVNEVSGFNHGQEFVIDAPTTAKLGLKGSSMSDFKSKFSSPMPVDFGHQMTDFNNQVAPVADNSKVESKLTDIHKAIQNKPEHGLRLKQLAFDAIELIESRTTGRNVVINRTRKKFRNNGGR